MLLSIQLAWDWGFKMKAIRLLAILVLSVGLFGCSKMSSNNESASGNSAFGTGPDAPRKVHAVVSRNQLLPNYLACTGLPEDQVSNATRDEVNNALNAMTEEGNVEGITAPMLMAFTKISAEICNDLISYEQNGQRRYFSGFNLNNNNDNQQLDLGRTVRSLASSCWGRQATATEVNMVLNNVGNTAISNNDDESMALYLCTAVLASSSATKF